MAPLLLLLSATAQGQAEVAFGNQFLVGVRPDSVIVDTHLTQWARFTAVKKAIVNAAQIKLAEADAPAIEVGLQADDGGNPDGKFLVSGTLASPQPGWNRVPWQSTTLEKGKVYYLVISAPGGGSVGCYRLKSAPNGFQPTGFPDPQWAQGSERVDPRSSLIFVLETETLPFLGQPYISRANARTAGEANIPAQRFVFEAPSGGEDVVDSITLLLTAEEASPVDYTLALLDEENTIIESIKIPPSEITNGVTQNYTFPLTTKPRLVSGKAYSLAFFNESEIGKIAWIGAGTDPGESLEKATWQGKDGYAFRYTDPSLKTPEAASYNRDFNFHLNLRK